MIEAIVYTTNAGTTAKYAELLGRKIGLPVYALKQARGKLPEQTEILYLGWIFASHTQGYKAAAKRYKVRAVCAVGMGATGTQVEEVRAATALPEATPLFTLQGGLTINKLHGLSRIVMANMAKTVGKDLTAKSARTPEEEDLLDMILHGGDRVSEEHLAEILAWYNAER